MWTGRYTMDAHYFSLCRYPLIDDKLRHNFVTVAHAVNFDNVMMKIYVQEEDRRIKKLTVKSHWYFPMVHARGGGYM